MRGFPKEKVYVNRELDKWLNILSDMFDWQGIDDELLERDLLTFGYMGALKLNDEVYTLKCSYGGEPDYRNRYTKLIFANHILGNHERTVHENGVILRANTNRIPITDYLIPHLVRLYHIDLSLHKATIDTRSPYFATAPTTTSERALNKMFDKIIDGEYAVCVDNLTITDGIKTLPYANQNSNTITTLMEERQFVVSQIWALFGIDVNNNMKREALNQGETHINEDSTKPLIEDMLRCRQEFCEECNTLFGTNYSVEFGGIWKRNEIKEETEIEMLENEAEQEESNGETVESMDNSTPTEDDNSNA